MSKYLSSPSSSSPYSIRFHPLPDQTSAKAAAAIYIRRCYLSFPCFFFLSFFFFNSLYLLSSLDETENQLVHPVSSPQSRQIKGDRQTKVRTDRRIHTNGGTDRRKDGGTGGGRKKEKKREWKGPRWWCLLGDNFAFAFFRSSSSSFTSTRIYTLRPPSKPGVNKVELVASCTEK